MIHFAVDLDIQEITETGSLVASEFRVLHPRPFSVGYHFKAQVSFP